MIVVQDDEHARPFQDRVPAADSSVQDAPGTGPGERLGIVVELALGVTVGDPLAVPDVDGTADLEIEADSVIATLRVAGALREAIGDALGVASALRDALGGTLVVANELCALHVRASAASRLSAAAVPTI
jgi:hypothetical protein